MLGPQISEVISEKKDMRMKRSDTALIIPTYNNSEALKEHFERLKEQTPKDFDIIIIYGENDEFVEADGLSILHMREQGRNGCEGALFIGQKTALDEGYKTIIMADDDCFPETANLLEDLKGAMESGEMVVMPNRKTPKGKVKHNLIFHYGCVSHEVLKKVGLVFYPFYFGGGDLEFLERIKKHNIKISHVPSEVSHRIYPHPLIDSIIKRYYYTKGGFEGFLLLDLHWRAFVWASTHLAGAFVYWILGRKKLGKLMMRALIDGSKMRFFRSQPQGYEEDLVETVPAQPSDGIAIRNDRTIALDHLVRIKGPATFLYLVRLALKSLSFFAHFGRYFGKKVTFLGAIKPIHFPILLMSRSGYLSYEGKTYELYRDRDAISIAIGILALLLAAPFIVLISSLLVISGVLSKKGMTTIGYGIRG